MIKQHGMFKLDHCNHPRYSTTADIAMLLYQADLQTGLDGDLARL